MPIPSSYSEHWNNIIFRDEIDWIICVVCWLISQMSWILLSSCCCYSFPKQHDCIHYTSMACAESFLAPSKVSTLLSHSGYLRVRGWEWECEQLLTSRALISLNTVAYLSYQCLRVHRHRSISGGGRTKQDIKCHLGQPVPPSISLPYYLELHFSF